MSKEAQQFVFDTALTHIRAQGVPSYTNEENGAHCKYRYNDLGCAFAPMISEYNEKMEGLTPKLLVRDYSECLYPSAIEAGFEFCNKVQFCHDGSVYSTNFIKEFERKMSNLAKEYELVYIEKDVTTESVEYEPVS